MAPHVWPRLAPTLRCRVAPTPWCRLPSGAGLSGCWPPGPRRHDPRPGEPPARLGPPLRSDGRHRARLCRRRRRDHDLAGDLGLARLPPADLHPGRPRERPVLPVHRRLGALRRHLPGLGGDARDRPQRRHQPSGGEPRQRGEVALLRPRSHRGPPARGERHDPARAGGGGDRGLFLPFRGPAPGGAGALAQGPRPVPALRDRAARDVHGGIHLLHAGADRAARGTRPSTTC